MIHRVQIASWDDNHNYYDTDGNMYRTMGDFSPSVGQWVWTNGKHIYGHTAGGTAPVIIGNKYIPILDVQNSEYGYIDWYGHYHKMCDCDFGTMLIGNNNQIFLYKDPYIWSVNTGEKIIDYGFYVDDNGASSNPYNGNFPVIACLSIDNNDIYRGYPVYTNNDMTIGSVKIYKNSDLIDTYIVPDDLKYQPYYYSSQTKTAGMYMYGTHYMAPMYIERYSPNHYYSGTFYVVQDGVLHKLYTHSYSGFVATFDYNTLANTYYNAYDDISISMDSYFQSESKIYKAKKLIADMSKKYVSYEQNLLNLNKNMHYDVLKIGNGYLIYNQWSKVVHVDNNGKYTVLTGYCGNSNIKVVDHMKKPDFTKLGE